MSGKIVNNVFRASGVIAATPGGLDWSTAVVTGSTLTATAGKGYFINTTSNTCTVTLPSSAEIGDQIVFADYARTWSTNNVIIDSNGLNFQGDPDTYTVDYSTAGQSLNIVYSDATKGWLPVSDDAVADVGVAPAQAIFAFGRNSSSAKVSLSNKVSTSGVIASDTTGVGTERFECAACSFGGDKGIYGYGTADSGAISLSNKVSNSGVVASDVSGVGTARRSLNACGFGLDKGIFAFGQSTNVKNLVSNTGVISADATGVGTARHDLCAVTFGLDKGIFSYGHNSGANKTNLISNTGVVAADIDSVGTRRGGAAGLPYGSTGQAMFAFGAGVTNAKNLISSSGVVSADATGVGTARSFLDGTKYGIDTGIFAYGQPDNPTNLSNLVSNTGVVASDTTGVGTARRDPKATTFG